MKVREILNKVKWDRRMDFDFDQLEVVYLHRGAPSDLKKIYGREIVHIGKSFLSLKGAEIPYHRIIKISYKEKVLFERKNDGHKHKTKTVDRRGGNDSGERI